MVYSFIIQTDYKKVSLGLLKNKIFIQEIFLEKHEVSQFLMEKFLILLRENDLTWADISYIGVNQGPGPFTTLRAIIATVNGISFSVGVPLIGIDGLATFLTEYSFKTDLVVCIFNAFNQDLYFAVTNKNQIIYSGWRQGNLLLEELAELYSLQNITFIGNGVVLFNEEIKRLFGENVLFPDPFPEFPSLQHIALTANEYWNEMQEGSRKLTPLYLKSNTYKASCSSV